MHFAWSRSNNRRRLALLFKKNRVSLAFLVAEEYRPQVPSCMPEDARGGGRDGGAPQERVGLGNHCQRWNTVSEAPDDSRNGTGALELV